MLLPCRALMNLLEYIVKYKRFKIVSVLCYVCVCVCKQKQLFVQLGWTIIYNRTLHNM